MRRSSQSVFRRVVSTNLIGASSGVTTFTAARSFQTTPVALNLPPNPLKGKAPGMTRAAQSIPLDSPEMAREINHLAKAAHQARNFDDAAGLYDRVLAHRRNTLGLFHEDVAATLNNIGRVFIDSRNYAAAENALSEACAIYEKRFGTNSLKYADSLGLLALAYRDLQFHEESEKAFKEAISVFRDHCYDFNNSSWIPADKRVPTPPNESPLASVAHLLSDCAVLFINRDWLPRAVTFLEEALDIRRFLYTGNAKFKPIIAQTLAKLAEVKRSLGDADTAMVYIEECIDICMETMGRESPATASAISSKGNILSVTQRYHEARKCYEEACTTYAMAYGKESPLVASEMIHLGRMMEFTGDHGEAEKKFVRAAEIYRSTLGPDHIQLADANMLLAASVMKRQQFDRAVPLLRDAIRIRSKGSRNDPALVFCYHKLGDALAAMKDAEAEAHFLHAIELHRQQFEDTKQEARELLMTDVMDDLALHYMQFHMNDKAETIFKDALKIRLKNLGEAHSSVGYSYSNLSLLYLSMEKYPECLENADLSLTAYEKSTQQSWLAVSDVQMTKGQCYAKMKNWMDAKKVFEQCLGHRRRLADSAEIQVAETLHDLAKVNIQLGETKEAAKQLDEAMKLARRYLHVTAELQAAIDATRRSFPALGGAQ